MELRKDWEAHLALWKEKLIKAFYTPIGEIQLKGFKTFRQLSLEEAETIFKSGQTCKFPEDTKWGEVGEYAWLYDDITIPETFSFEKDGKKYPTKNFKISMQLNPGGESALFVNGREVGNRRNDWIKIDHHFVCDLVLSDYEPGCAKYHLVMETMGTTGPRICEAGPLFHGEEPFKEHETPYTKVGKSTFGIWNEEAYQLWLEVRILEQIARKQPSGSSRRNQIFRALRNFTTMVDFSRPFDEFLETVVEARKMLQPLLSCKNGSSQATMYAFGHAHIDVAWLWTLKESERKCARTFGAQIVHMERYPDYVFLQSQPQLYQMTKEHYPQLYAKIKEKVAEGKFIPEGGMWVEADTNLSGGEALIRQFLHGKRFFREEFGVDNEILWLPDVFGYSGALPQIMAGCGIKYFSTCKIFWNYTGGEDFPYNYFKWIGIDGTQVTAFLHDDYNSSTDPEAMIDRWENRAQQDMNANMFLVPYGYGDGGGGPTRDHIECALKEKDLEGTPKMKLASPVDFFHDLEKQGLTPEEEYVGELYFPAHRGTYTSQALVKKGNRKSELALREAEILSSAALSEGFKYPYEDADKAWKHLLLNQFHDVLPGSSVAAVYETTHDQHRKILDFANELSGRGLACMSEKDPDVITVFNSISWDREELIRLPEGWKGATTLFGDKLMRQQIGEGYYVKACVPEMGFLSLKRAEDSLQLPEKHFGVRVSETLMENNRVKVQFNEKGEITSIVNKETSEEWCDGLCNSLHMYQDVPSQFDAWDLEAFYKAYPVALEEAAKITVVAEGDLMGVLKVERKIHHSVFTQYISLREGESRLEFNTHVTWAEQQKILKVNFPVRVHAQHAMQEIQFGYIERPTHCTKQADKDKFEVCNHKWTALTDQNRGAAILNDCKYGISVEKNSMNLTLLNAGAAPDKKADQGEHDFSYSLLLWEGVFVDSPVSKDAYALNCPIRIAEGRKETTSLIRTNANNLVVETVKPAEDRSGDLIVRIYEALNAATVGKIEVNLPFSKIEICNMLEEGVELLQTTGNQVQLEFRPFEIKTLRLRHRE